MLNCVSIASKPGNRAQWRHRRNRQLAAGRWLGILLATPAVASPSLDQILSMPFPLEVAASPTGSSVAWIEENRGARNVRISSGLASPGAKPVDLTHNIADDGREMSELTWAQRGKTLVFTRGGSSEVGGAANPSSLAAGPQDRQIFAIDSSGGPARLLATGHGTAAAPGSGLVAFVQGKEIRLVDLDKPDKATAIVIDQGTPSDLSWSPDGKKLAFVSGRDGHDLVGIWSEGDDHIVWMTPSVDRDGRPCWSPDGKRIAWVRRRNSPSFYYQQLGTHRAGEPWSLWVGNPANGEGSAVWTANPGDGSLFREIESGKSLFWVGAHIVFPWEGSGWLRLYALNPDAAAGKPMPITPDHAEVFAAAPSADGSIYFSSNANDLNRRHLWSVNPERGVATQLTSGKGIEDQPAVAANGAVFAMHGDATHQLTVAAFSRSQMISIEPVTDLQANISKVLVEPMPLEFASGDGLILHGQLFMPTKRSSSPAPAIIFFHGGPKRQMLPGWYPSLPYNRMYGLNQYLAASGYIVLSVNYRGGTGYGLAFREAENLGFQGASEAQDAGAATDYIDHLSGADPTRVGAWGLSYGGTMTAFALGRYPTRYAAGVDIAGIHDWVDAMPYLSSPSAPKGAASLASASSPVASVGQWRAPTLLIQADYDHSVDFGQMMLLVRAIRAQGKVDLTQMVLPDETHVYLRYQDWLKVLSATGNFLDAKLKAH